MAESPLTAYVRDNLAAGYQGPVIRERLLASGWSAEAIDAAFAQSTPSTTLSTTAVRPRRGTRTVRPKWTHKRQLKTAVAVVAMIVGGFWVHSLIAPDDTDQTAANQLQHLSLQTRQANDINTIAGAVGQYTAASGGILPLATSDSEGSLVLCGVTCDPLTSQVASLGVYKPSGVTIVPYSAGLMAPDTATIYLVPLAKCALKSVNGPNTNPRSMVLLYQAATTPTSTPRCLSL